MFDAAAAGAPLVVRRYHDCKRAWVADRMRPRMNERAWADFQDATDRLKAAVEAAGGLLVCGDLRYHMKGGGLALERDVDRGEDIPPGGCPAETTPGPRGVQKHRQGSFF